MEFSVGTRVILPQEGGRYSSGIVLINRGAGICVVAVAPEAVPSIGQDQILNAAEVRFTVVDVACRDIAVENEAGIRSRCGENPVLVSSLVGLHMPSALEAYTVAQQQGYLSADSSGGGMQSAVGAAQALAPIASPISTSHCFTDLGRQLQPPPRIAPLPGVPQPPAGLFVPKPYTSLTPSSPYNAEPLPAAALPAVPVGTPAMLAAASVLAGSTAWDAPQQNYGSFPVFSTLQMVRESLPQTTQDSHLASHVPQP